ncbi:unnamed protein product, partial [Tetraodon nigroviridis]
RIRAVEVARGRTGYGFTLSGQSPCVLSRILKGSPADYVGLRSGDYILSVNDINVSKASHEDVVKLIGRCSGVLKLVTAEGERHRRHHHQHQQRSAGSRHNSGGAKAAAYLDSCSSEEDLDPLYDNSVNNNNNSRSGGGGRGGWYKPKLDPRQLGIDRAERVVAELQSGGIFNMIFENSSHSSSSSDKDRPGVPAPAKPRPPSDPDFAPYRKSSRSQSNPNLLSEEEMAQVLHDDSVFLESDFHHLHLHRQEEQDADVGDGADLMSESGEGILTVGMIVGYLGSIELASTGTSLENDSLQAIRCSMRRLRAEQKIHSLVLMKVMHDSVRLCSDKGQVLATYPAEKLAFSACCPDDRRFFGLVTMQATDDLDERRFGRGREDEGSLRTSCHVFIVDPELCLHQVKRRGEGSENVQFQRLSLFFFLLQVHLGVARRFGFECTPDPDTGGCLEFPPSSHPLLQFVSILYRDMGDGIEGVRARAFNDPDNDAQQNHSTSSNSDSGIGNFLQEEKSNRVLLVDLGGPPNHSSGPRHWESPPSSQQAWSPTLGAAASHPPLPPPPPPPPPLRNGQYRHESHMADLPHPLPLAHSDVSARHSRGVHPHSPAHAHARADPLYLGNTAGHVGMKCRQVLLLISQSDSTRVPDGPQEPVAAPHQPLAGCRQHGKIPKSPLQTQGSGGRFRGLTMGFPPLPQRSSSRRSFGRSKRLSLARSLDDLELVPEGQRAASNVPLGGCCGGGGQWGWRMLRRDALVPVGCRYMRLHPVFLACSRSRSPMGACLYGNGACLQENGTSSSHWRQHVCKGREVLGCREEGGVCRGLRRSGSYQLHPGEQPGGTGTRKLNSVELQGCSSDNSLNSNASLPSVQSHRRHTERRVASWAVSFERLLQDPVGVRYFSEFLKKEFSEENILFWQACEFFSHVPESDKKQLSQRAREIYKSFLSSKATTPVNIDSQAQLADDILNAPRPDMFKEQQLQIYNLMKFDSYTRFLKSLLYQECMLAEVEGRPLPDPYHIPSSPTSKHSTTGSDRSNLSTPKKEDKKSKSGRSLNDDSRDDSGDRRKGMFFSWSRNRSFGKGPKKRELADFNYNFSTINGRRESQGSLSSGASLELGTSGSGKNEGDVCRGAASAERGGGSAPLRQCNISLPDGSCCSVPLRAGVTIRDLLMGLCEKLCINLAAVDLFLVGGEKPLVLDQDCMTLCSRDLRLEKRTLFRLDLVPINRSVGLKAKPTKPVTEVLRPVVAKYGLHLSDLVARISGELEPLDLGLPISNLDGLRVVLDTAEDPVSKDRQVVPSTSRTQSATGEARPSGTAGSARPTGENGQAGPSSDPGRQAFPTHSVSLHTALEKRKQKKINIDEAEEFFDLISKAQSNRADDQRGLLNKSDLQLPDFLQLSPDQAAPPPHPPGPAAPPLIPVTPTTAASRAAVAGAIRRTSSEGADAAATCSARATSPRAWTLRWGTRAEEGGKPGLPPLRLHSPAPSRPSARRRPLSSISPRTLSGEGGSRCRRRTPCRT